MTADRRERIAEIVRDSLRGTDFGLLFDILIDDLQSQAQGSAEISELRDKRIEVVEEVLVTTLERLGTLEEALRNLAPRGTENNSGQ